MNKYGYCEWKELPHGLPGYLVNSYLSVRHKGCIEWQREFREIMFKKYCKSESPIKKFIDARHIWYLTLEFANQKFYDGIHNKSDYYKFPLKCRPECGGSYYPDYYFRNNIYKPIPGKFNLNIDIRFKILPADTIFPEERIICYYYIGPEGSIDYNGFYIYKNGLINYPYKNILKQVFNCELTINNIYLDYKKLKLILDNHIC